MSREAIEMVIAAWEREPVWTRADVIAGLRAALAEAAPPNHEHYRGWCNACMNEGGRLAEAAPPSATDPDGVIGRGMKVEEVKL